MSLRRKAEMRKMLESKRKKVIGISTEKMKKRKKNNQIKKK
jgi:hypothetical protein